GFDPPYAGRCSYVFIQGEVMASSAQQRKQSITPPNRRQLERWAEVCRYIDAQPYRSVKTPFPQHPPMSAKLLNHMAQSKLVRHRDDCRWQVSQRWQGILNNLARGITDEKPQRPQESDQVPFVVDFGVDTFYVNVLAEAVPTPFLTLAYELKERAQVEYKPI